MTDDDTELRRLAGWVSAWSWPMTKDDLLTSAVEFGWTVTSNRPGKGARWDTGLPSPGASATVVDGEVADLSITTSEYFEDDAAGRRALNDALAHQVELVSAVLGPPAARKPGRNGSARWNLPSGSALEVRASAGGCYWAVTSPEFVEIERDLGSTR